MFASHWGYYAVMRKPASICFCTSSFIWRANSGRLLLNFCLTGGHSGFSGRRCSTMLVSNPGMSWYNQANTSANSLSSSIKLSLVERASSDPILISFLTSSDPRLTISIVSSWGWMILSSSLSNREISSGISSISSSSASNIGNSKLQEGVGSFLSAGFLMINLRDWRGVF